MKKFITLLCLGLLIQVSAVSAQVVTENQKKAEAYYQEAERYLANRFVIRDQNYRDVIKLYQKAAKLGHSASCQKLAWCYDEGKGTDKKPKDAIKWYQEALRIGGLDSLAISRIYTNIGINYSRLADAKANEYFQKGMEMNNARATLIMAQRYHNGTRVPRDKKEAARLFAVAVESKYEVEEVWQLVLKDREYLARSVRHGSDIYLSREETDFSKSYPDAAYAYKYACWKTGKEKTDIAALLNTGSEFAVRLAQKLAEGGDTKAEESLIQYLWNGGNESDPQNRAKAIAFWERTKDRTHSQDMLIIAKGEGLYDKEIPEEWYTRHRSRYDDVLRQPAENGNKEAMYALGVSADRREYLESLIQQGDYRAAEAYDRIYVYSGDKGINLLLQTASKTGYDKIEADAKFVQENYRKAVSLASSGRTSGFKDFDQGYDSERLRATMYKLERIVKFYSAHPDYDKHKVTGTAENLLRFLNVCYIVEYDYIGGPYWHRSSLLMSAGCPIWEDESVNRQWTRLHDAAAICKTPTNEPAFTSFYAKAAKSIEAKCNEFQANLDKQKLVFETEYNKYKGISDRAYSSSTSSSSSSTSSSSSNGSGDKYSCDIKITFKNGDTLYKGTITAYFKGFANTSKKEFTSDKAGNVHATWSDSEGKEIEAIYVHRNLPHNDAYTKEGLSLKNSGRYTVCADCK